MKRKCRALDGIVTLVRMTTCEEVIKSNTCNSIDELVVVQSTRL